MSLPYWLERFTEKTPVLDQGFVRLVDVMGDDGSVVEAARVTTGKGRSLHKWECDVEEADDNGPQWHCHACNQFLTWNPSDKERTEVCMAGDARLIRFMLRHQHWSPFHFAEMTIHLRLPMDAWRQLVRHWSLCLAGDTLLHFDNPTGLNADGSGSHLYTMTLADVWRKFQPTRGEQGDAFFKRSRVQNMLLRCIDEDTREVRHTRIVDCWQSGIRQLYRVVLDTGEQIRMSADHLCLTDVHGWLPLRDIVQLPTAEARWKHAWPDSCLLITVGPSIGKARTPEPNKIDEDTEEWRAVVGWEGYYAVSSQGRVKRVVGGRGSRSFGRVKQQTPNAAGYMRTGLNRPGVEVIAVVHHLVLEAFVGPRPAGAEGRHLDGNPQNNEAINLAWGSVQENAEDRVRHGTSKFLGYRKSKIIDVLLDAEEMAYDIEVEGPWHNFVANGVVVHNCPQEYSTRYSPAVDAIAATAPDAWRAQGGSNRQGSRGFVTTFPEGFVMQDGYTPGDYLTGREAALHDFARDVYEERLAFGVAKEQARKDLPLSNYTDVYLKGNLRNWLNMLAQRLDSHAQYEIRQYAQAIAEIVKVWCPLSWEAFTDWRLNAQVLSAQQVEVVRFLLADAFETARELAASEGRALDFETWAEDLLDEYHVPPSEAAEFFARFRVTEPE